MFTRRQLFLAIGMVVALAILIVFSVRAAQHARHLHPAADEPIQGWMNIGYIAHSYHVPAYVLAQALGLPPTMEQRWPIERIARFEGRSLDAVKSDLMHAIVHSRPPYPPPSPPPRPRRLQ